MISDEKNSTISITIFKNVNPIIKLIFVKTIQIIIFASLFWKGAGVV